MSAKRTEWQGAEELDALLARRPAPPFDILRAHHAELHVADLEASRAFYVDALGLIETERTEDAVYLRAWEEYHHHSLVLRAADRAAVEHLALRVRDEEDLERLEQHFSAAGRPLAWHTDERAQGRALRVLDPLGYPLEFFAEMELVPSQLREYHRQRGAPIMRLDHFNLHAPDVEAAVRFWQDMGFRCSECIVVGGSPDRVAGAWLLRAPGVHDVALTAGTGPRLHHIAYFVAESTGILRACDQLAAAGYATAIERGPGRHGVSNAFFVYIRDPDGHRIELYTSDYYTGDPDLPTLRWDAADPRCRTFWGARAPDSWYEESSLLLDLDGQPVAVGAAAVEERSAFSG